jgi:electron transfer flavoprotein beta subunit
LIAEMEVTLPAVLGVQAAEQPPRYVAVSKVRQAMKDVGLQEQPAPEWDASGGLSVRRMFLPQAPERATMLEGDAQEIAARLIAIFTEADVL